MFKYLIFLLIALTLAAPTSAQTDFEVSGWIPYWETRAGARDARRQLNSLTEINPFGYSVREDGSLNDLAKVKSSHWKKLFTEARKKDVRILPTVMWSDGSATHRVLSDAKLRADHIKAITSMVKKGKFDGVDIDYESKKFETKNYYSLFLTELKLALGDKLLSCTIESRTPPESLYTTPPAGGPKYVNDFAVIGQVCDRVKIMAYDQRNADIKLNASKAAGFYMPVADADWVRKVMLLVGQQIPKEKLLIGVATYGHEYEVNISPNGKKTYKRIGSINPEPAQDKAKEFLADLSRQASGEIGYTYASLGALRYVTWSDAAAIKQKVDLARELGWRGVAIFKIDGGEDPKIWKLF